MLLPHFLDALAYLSDDNDLIIVAVAHQHRRVIGTIVWENDAGRV
jgi:hypothetical protein